MESSTLPMRQSTAGALSGAAVGAGSASASRRFPAATTSVGQARRFLIEQLPEGPDDGADALVLMLSELATNAVQHAATESSALPASHHPVTEAITEPPSGRAGPDGNGAAESPAPPVGTAAVEPTFPVKGVRAVLDGLRDAIVATDERGQIRYANIAAEDLMGWPHGSLVSPGRSPTSSSTP